jgi:hypothetical protein
MSWFIKVNSGVMPLEPEIHPYKENQVINHIFPCFLLHV